MGLKYFRLFYNIKEKKICFKSVSHLHNFKSVSKYFGSDIFDLKSVPNVLQN